MEQFRAYRIFEEAGKAHGRIVDMTLDQLDPGEVVVKSAYSSVNFKDTLSGTGKGKIVRRFPCVGGIDGCGTVVSSSDHRFKEGDEILCTGYDMGAAHDGGYAGMLRLPGPSAKPLEKAQWAAAFDSVGGEQLAALTRSMQPDGVIASFGNAGGIELHTTVLPFILRGIQLIGVNSLYTALPLRRAVWQRIATDLKPQHLNDIVHTIALDDLDATFERMLKGKTRGRTVVKTG